MADSVKNAREQSESGGRKGWSWIIRGLAVSLAAAVAFTASYAIFNSQVDELKKKSYVTAEKIAWLYQNTYLLYRDLYNRENQVHVSFEELYLEPEEEYRWLMDENLRRKYADYYDYDTLSDTSLAVLPEGNLPVDLESLSAVSNELGAFKDIMEDMESEQGILNGLYSYYVRDDTTGYYVTNMSEGQLENFRNTSYFLLSFTFDGAGNVSVGNEIAGEDVYSIRQKAAQAVNKAFRLDQALYAFQEYGAVKMPVNCTVTYAVANQAWSGGVGHDYEIEEHTFYANHQHDNTFYYYNMYFYNSRSTQWMYVNAGLSTFLFIFLLAVGLLGCIFPIPGESGLWKGRLLRAIPLEGLAAVGFCLLAISGSLIELAVLTSEGKLTDGLYQITGAPPEFASFLVLLLNLMAFTAAFFVAWYLGVCLRAVRELGLKEYIRKRSLIYRFFPFVKGKLRKVYRYFLSMDLTKNANKAIARVLLVNALILFVISSLWLGGLLVTVIYSGILYLVLRKYVSDLQKRYGILLKAVDEIAKGNLNVSIDGDLGVFEPFKPQVIKIQNGFRKAVEEEVKSQHMKAELITNVSHDLKTPLTAIITYVNLLKDEDLTPQQRREYLDTLERKSLRLKVLIEDLFEVSKANSGNVTLNLMPVDIMNLIRQVGFEMQDKLDEAQLDVRMNLGVEKMVLSLDSQKTYRVYENLFANVAKYALRGTRVYVNGFRIDDTVVITIKNISAQEITMDVEDLTERFVRGDASRNTEGSGLGLAIAKSFMELQGGRLEIEVDGDLFKATTVWHLA